MAEKLNKDAVYKAAKPEEKDYFINDGGGLYLWVKSGGSKLWQFVYTFEGKRKRLALGAYPGVTLEIARRKASEIREQLANDSDPAERRKKVRADKKTAKLNQERKADETGRRTTLLAGFSIARLPGNLGHGGVWYTNDDKYQAHKLEKLQYYREHGIPCWQWEPDTEKVMPDFPVKT